MNENIVTGALIYVAIGAGIAAYSGTRPVFFTFLWPWPVAAQIVKNTTGKYPSWTPNL